MLLIICWMMSENEYYDLYIVRMPLSFKFWSISMRIGRMKIPRKPNSFAPKYIHSSISRGCKPICLPTIFGSMILRMTVMTRYRISSPTHVFIWLFRKQMRIQGIMIPPVPRTGSTSKMAIKKAMTRAFSIPRTYRPMVSSRKVSSIIFP